MSLFCNIFNSILNFIYPPICILCNQKHKKSTIICPQCIHILEASAQLFFKNNPSDFYHIKSRFFFDGIYYFWEYTPEIQKMVHHLKYQEATHLAQILGKIMAANFDDINKIDMIVPVPLHKVRQRERGFNQSECISLVLSRILKIKLQSNILKRMSYTPTQTHLTAEERQNNLKDIFNLSDNSVKGKSILLVDDVITTGSTINACAKVFKSSGASQVFGCSIARPELRLMKESA